MISMIIIIVQCCHIVSCCFKAFPKDFWRFESATFFLPATALQFWPFLQGRAGNPTSPWGGGPPSMPDSVWAGKESSSLNPGRFCDIYNISHLQCSQTKVDQIWHWKKTVYDEEDRFLSFPSFIVSLSISYRNALPMCFFFCEIFRGQLLSKTTPVSKFDNISATCAWLRGFLGYEIIWSDPVCTWSEGPCTWCRTGGMPSATACTLGRGLSTILKGRQHQQ